MCQNEHELFIVELPQGELTSLTIPSNGVIKAYVATHHMHIACANNFLVKSNTQVGDSLKDQFHTKEQIKIASLTILLEILEMVTIVLTSVKICDSQK